MIYFSDFDAGGPPSDDWTPAQLSADILAWLDANSGISTSGSNVTGWASRVGSVSLSPGATTPGASTTSGHPIVTYDGADYLSGTMNLTGTDATVAFVGTLSGAGGSFGRIWSLGNSGAASDSDSVARACLARSSTNNSIMIATNSATSSPVSVGYNVVFIAIVRFTGSAASIRVNGVAGGGLTVSNNFSVNKLALRHAANNTSGAAIGGGMDLECIPFDRALTDAECEKIEGYAGHRYKFAKSLPSSHPYRDNAPTISGVTGPALGAPPLSRHWRHRSTSTYTSGFLACTELEQRESVGGADTTTGRTASSAANAGAPYLASMAIDDNLTTFHTSGGTAPAGGNWLAVDHGAGNERSIVEISWKMRPDGFREDPANLFHERSSEGTYWFPEWTDLSIPASSAGQVRVFARP